MGKLFFHDFIFSSLISTNQKMINFRFYIHAKVPITEIVTNLKIIGVFSFNLVKKYFPSIFEPRSGD